MRKLFIVIVIILVSSSLPLQAQRMESQLPKPVINAEKLFQKSKNQKTAAWIFLSGGAVIGAIGFATAVNEGWDSFAGIFDPNYVEPKTSASEVLAITGLVAIASSIPLFIASGKNKKKAGLMIKNEKVFITPEANTKTNMVSMELKINL